ncbi:phage tail tube protein [Corynebacterium ureicelerivorans]
MADSRNRNNVLVGAPDVQAQGGFQIGDKVADTTNYPTNATEPLNPALGLRPSGFIGEDGITKTVNRSTEKIRDWNRDTVIVVETEHDVMFRLTFLEAANANVLRFTHGPENVTVDGTSITVAEAAGELPHFTAAFDMRGGDGKKMRVFIPDGQVTSVGDVSFVKNDVIRYEVEIEAFSDADGKKAYLFTEVPEGAAGVDSPAGSVDAPEDEADV